MEQGTSEEDGAIVTVSDGQSATGPEAGGQHGVSGVPPSFGASAPPPVPQAPVPPAAAPPSSAPQIPEPAVTAAPPQPPVQPEPETVGWYPNAPAAGPFAAPAAPRRTIARIPARPGPSRQAAARLPSWGRGRGTLANVLLLGFAPLALAGVIVAAFVLVSPGKGSAAARFQVGPGASASQPTASTQASGAGVGAKDAATTKRHVRRGKPSPSPSPSAAKSPHAAKTGKQKKPPAKPKPRPTRGSGGGTVVPHNLGVPNFDGYCQHIGARTAELTASNAYGWHCTLNPSVVLPVTNVCAWTYHLSTSQVVSVSTNFFDPTAWQCWRINRDLGVLDFDRYCAAAGLGSGKLIAGNAYGWRCTGSSAPIDTTAACDTVYQVSDAISRFAVFADPYSWQCWN